MLKKNITKLPLIMLLSTSISSLQSHVTQTDVHDVATERGPVNLIPKKVSFAGTIIVKMDGIPGILDAESIADCFSTVQKIIQLINGILNHATGQHVGLFEFEGEFYTLKQIVVMENRLIKNNVAHDHPDYIKFNHILAALKEIFQREAGPLLEKTKKPALKSMNAKLISLWIERADRHNSILKEFGTIEELAALERANAKEFFFFLNDLKRFLTDIMRNAPKACDLYKKECLKPENYQAFDNFLNS